MERLDPVASLLEARMCAEEARRACAALELASAGLWWFFGLSCAATACSRACNRMQ